MKQLQQFALDKGLAAIYEGLAAGKIEDWYRLQAKAVTVRYNEENGLEAKRGFDLIDTYGLKWESKCDKIAVETGRTFISSTLRHKSTADFVVYLIPPGAYILPRSLLLSLPTIGDAAVGDGQRELGQFISLDVLRKYADLV